MTQDKVPPLTLEDEDEPRGGKRRNASEERRIRREESRPGGVSYVEQGGGGGGGRDRRYDNGGQRGGGGKGFSMSTFLAAIACAAAIAAGLMMTMAAGKGTVDRLDQNLAALQGQTAALAETVAANGVTLDNVVNSQGEYAKNTDLDAYAKVGDYASKASVDSIQTQIDGLHGELDALEGLEARVAALETEEEEQQGVEEEGDNVYIEDLGWYGAISLEDNGNPQEFALNLKVVNGLSKDIEDIEIDLILHTWGETVDFDEDDCKVVSFHPLQFKILHIEEGIVVLEGADPTWGSGLVVEADDDERVSVTIQLQTENPSTETKTLYVEAEVSDYKVVE